MAQNTFGTIPRAPSQKDLRTRRAIERMVDAPMATVIPVDIALDNFSSANTVALTSHTMDLGFGWVYDQSSGNNVQVQAGNNEVLFDQNGHGGNMVVHTATSQSGGTFYMSIRIPSGKSFFIGLAFRVANNGDDLVTCFLSNITSPGLYIEERVSASYTQRAFSAFTVADDTTYTIVAVLLGTTLTATVNGGPTVSYNQLSTNTTGIDHGMIGGGVGTSDLAYAIGPWRMTDP